MSITSSLFALFATGTAILYFSFPKRNYRWAILLISSCVFYLYNSFTCSAFIFITIISIYLASVRIEAISSSTREAVKANKGIWTRDERKAYKAAAEKRRTLILVLTLLLNFGILFMLKYFNFLSGSIASILGTPAENVPRIKLLMPLGVSFYTFISTGYLIDVYRETVRPEKNIFKFALFVSFFPHIVQGPISSYEKLHAQLIEPHDIEWIRFKQGIINISWGLFKKLVVADAAWIGIKNFYANGGINGTDSFEAYGGTMTLFISLLYALQLYADFSGGIDISRGICRILGIELEVNFRQPYFSKSISEYWRRWHITLGLWMKNYVFYPVAMSGFSVRVSKRIADSKFGQTPAGKHISKVLMTAVASFIVFMLVGIWHGANSKYIAFGVWNGLIIMLSAMLGPVYDKSKKSLHIKETAAWWSLFQMIRTFFIVLVGYVFDIADDFNNAIMMMWSMVSDQNISLFLEQLDSLGIRKIQYLAIAYGAVIMLYMSIRLEKTKVDTPAELLEKHNGLIQWAALLAIIMSVFLLGTYGPNFEPAEFVYQGF